MSDELDFQMNLPFVNLVSSGGKYDDESFCAGFEMGLLDFKLFQAAAIQAENLLSVIRKDNKNQADLIAMKHGMIIQQSTTDDSGEWVTCFFVRPNQSVEL